MATPASTTKKVAQADHQTDQFRRDLSHILIQAAANDDSPAGPVIQVGIYELRFKAKAPVSALIALIRGEDRIEAMTTYLRQCLESDTGAIEELLSLTDIEGLSEIIGALGEAYTGFPATS